MTNCPNCSSVLVNGTLPCPSCGPDPGRTTDQVATGSDVAGWPAGPPPGYEVLSRLGAGGMGVVWKARQSGLGRLVALKGLPDSLVGDDHARERFRREAEAIAHLAHEGIIRVYEVGEHAGRPYFSMEIVEGGTLADRLRGGPLPFRAAAELVEATARAVHAAHEAGILHRDLKPANVLLAEDGRPKVSDFGLARRLADDSTMTQAGAVVGTPNYMAPEQARGGVVGPRADVYGLGAVLYECLTGRPPFVGETVLDTLAQAVAADPVPPSQLRRNCPRDLETICLRCLSKEPERRYLTALSLANDLRHYLAGEPIIARPAGPAERIVKWARRRPALAALAALALILLLGLAGAGGLLAYLAEQNALREGQRRAEAEVGQRREADLRLQAERALYAGQIALAHRAVQACDAARAEEHLRACPTGMRGWEWRYLLRRCRPDQQVVEVSPDPIYRVALSPDGKTLALGIGNVTNGTKGGEVQLRDAETLRLLWSHRANYGAVPAMTFSPDGEELACSNVFQNLFDQNVNHVAMEKSGFSMLFVLSVKTGGLLRMLPDYYDYKWSRDGKRVAVSMFRERIATIRDAATGKVLFRTDEYPGPVVAVEWLNGDAGIRVAWRRSASQAGEDDWRIERDKLVKTSRPNGKAKASPDGKVSVRTDPDGSVTLLDVSTSAAVSSRAGHHGEVRGAEVRQVGGRLLLFTGGADRAVRVSDLTRGRPVATLLGNRAPVGWIAVSRAGDRLYSVGHDGTLRKWGMKFDVEQPEFDLGPDVEKLEFLTDERLAVRSAGVAVLNPRTGESRQLVPAGAFRPMNLNRRAGVLAVGDGSVARLFDLAGPAARNSVALRTGSIRALTVDPEGKRLFLARSRSTEVEEAFWLEARPLADGPASWTVPTTTNDRAMALAVSPDGTLLATVSVAGGVHLRDPADGRVVRELRPAARGGSWYVNRCVAFSPDGQDVAVGFGNATDPGERPEVVVWKAATGRERLRLRGHTAMVTGLAFSPDGRRLASASIDPIRGNVGEVKIWETADGAELLTLSGSFAVAFSPDGCRLAAFEFEEGDRRACLRVWDAAPAP